MDQLAVRMSGICKRYPRVAANRDVCLEARRGEVHAIVGENGAGKSTLMKILYGLVPADAGTIEVLGRPLAAHAPADAIAAGVGMVFQHFMLVPTLTVAENVVLGMEPRKAGCLFDARAAAALVRDVSERYGLRVDPDARIEDCPVGIQQRVEILKVLVRGAQVIVLDEPTAVLTPQEADALVAVIRGLAGQGKTVLLITHKLREVMAAADRITVMRQGAVVATLAAAGAGAAEIARLMVGRAVEAPKRGGTAVGPKTVLEVVGLGSGLLKDVSLSVRAGEIVGIAGVEGNGQAELVECIAGLRAVESGRIALDGCDITRASPRARLEAGLAHIAADRHRRSLVLDFTVEENAILGRQWRREFFVPCGVRRSRIAAEAERLADCCDVRPRDPRIPARSLSGGNQQKLVVGRELARGPKALLAAHPTRGLDVGAIEFVQRSLLAERERGAGILLVSAELSELMEISDRIAVMHGGRIVGEVDPGTADERRLGLLMAGQRA